MCAIANHGMCAVANHGTCAIANALLSYILVTVKVKSVEIIMKCTKYHWGIAILTK